ncbi:adhesion G-protein coupled receptor G5-like [Paramisgurnus dabryanus]|uniref:adhesion G-protein coupled receptor G5-like n=1 Tax=Paramisgurnus dabryanus TaxID=90735 RepID=UPI0031F472F4
MNDKYMFISQCVHYRAVTTITNDRMLFQRVLYMTLLLLVVIYNMDAGETCITYIKGTLTLENKTTMRLNLSDSAGLNINVTDTAERLYCNFRSYSCYIECSFFNVNKNFTTPIDINACVTLNEETKVNFTIENSNSSCIVVACLPEELRSLLNTKDTQMRLQDLSNIPKIKGMCLDTFQPDTFVLYTGVEQKAIHNVINFTNQSSIYSNEDFELSVVNVNMSTTDIVLVDVPLVYSDDPDLPMQQIGIPVEAFQKVTAAQPKVGIVKYISDEHFRISLKSESKIISKIIRIEVPGYDIKNLKNSLKIQFIVEKIRNDTNLSISCQFYDDKVDNMWKSDGCLTDQSNDSFVECSCDHMTPFAVLLTNAEIDKYHWEILSIISYIGCSLSALFCAVSMLSYSVDSNARKEVSTSIHVSLSAALFLLNISFMLSEWAATLTLKEVCVFIAVTIHYSLLCCFTWMAIEALHLYLLMIRVFNIHIKHYMVKLSLFGWGVPALFVGSLLSVNKTQNFYGPSRMSSLNKTQEFCWTTFPTPYAINISYLILVFLFSTGILITVSRKICMMRKVDKRHKVAPCKDVLTVLGLMCLLGTTWGLAFFTIGYTNYPILYLFCICNSTQGFYVFIWMCLIARKNRKQRPNFEIKSMTDLSKLQ